MVNENDSTFEELFWRKQVIAFKKNGENEFFFEALLKEEKKDLIISVHKPNGQYEMRLIGFLDYASKKERELLEKAINLEKRISFLEKKV